MLGVSRDGDRWSWLRSAGYWKLRTLDPPLLPRPFPPSPSFSCSKRKHEEDTSMKANTSPVLFARPTENTQGFGWVRHGRWCTGRASKNEMGISPTCFCFVLFCSKKSSQSCAWLGRLAPSKTAQDGATLLAILIVRISGRGREIVINRC